MANTREKLIELIEEVYYCSIEELADHLIANGVTFATDNNVGDKTNADRIRAMSDEELSKILYNHQVCYIRAKRRESCSEYGCEDCLLEWLKEPAEVDNG